MKIKELRLVQVDQNSENVSETTFKDVNFRLNASDLVEATTADFDYIAEGIITHTTTSYNGGPYQLRLNVMVKMENEKGKAQLYRSEIWYVKF